MAQLLSLGYFPRLTEGDACQSSFSYDIPYVNVTLQEAMRLFWIQKSLDVTFKYTTVAQYDDYCETKFTQKYTATYGPDIYANGAYEWPEDYAVYFTYYTKKPIDETYLPCYSLARIICPATGSQTDITETNGNENCPGRSVTFSRTVLITLFHTIASPINGKGGYLIINDKEVLINYGFYGGFSAFPAYTIGSLVGQCEFLSNEDGSPKYLLDVYGPDQDAGQVTEFSMKIDWNTNTWKFSP